MLGIGTLPGGVDSEKKDGAEYSAQRGRTSGSLRCDMRMCFDCLNSARRQDDVVSPATSM